MLQVGSSAVGAVLSCSCCASAAAVLPLLLLHWQARLWLCTAWHELLNSLGSILTAVLLPLVQCNSLKS
jgi:hypothetical protein